MLTDKAVKALAAGEKPFKRPDAGGLFLFVTPGGSKLWRMRYKIAGREKLLSFGPYPEVSLADARDARDKARETLRSGRDPSVEKRQRREAANGGALSFEAVARAWHAWHVAQWTDRHAADVLGSFDSDEFPTLGSVHVADITPPMVLGVLHEIEGRPAIETARRVRQRMSAVFQHAMASGIGQNDPAAVVRGQMAPLGVQSRSMVAQARP